MLTKITTSYAPSKEAWDKGIRVDSLFWWGRDIYNNHYIKVCKQDEEDFLLECPAPTASEWLELLPRGSNARKNKKNFIAWYPGYRIVYKNYADTLQDALCKLAMRLFEEGLIK